MFLSNLQHQMLFFLFSRGDGLWQSLFMLLSPVEISTLFWLALLLQADMHAPNNSEGDHSSFTLFIFKIKKKTMHVIPIRSTSDR